MSLTKQELREKQKLDETVQGFLSDLQESYTQGFAEPFPIRMPYKKIRKIAAVMAGATGAGIP